MQSAQHKAQQFAFESSYTFMTSTAYFNLFICVDSVHTVAQLVEASRYKPDGHAFDRNFS
jgi:2-keto-3-deoxy-L-rhamnonate aldolase RhmA